MARINVLDKDVTFYTKDDEDYICITDIARYKVPDTPADAVKNWTRRKDTIEFLGLWEKINNQDFKLVEFDQLKDQAGSNSFVLSPTKWIEKTDAIGIITRLGKFGGTYAHKLNHAGSFYFSALGSADVLDDESLDDVVSDIVRLVSG